MFKIDAQRLRRFAIPALAAVLGVLAMLSTQWAKRETAALREARARLERRQHDEAASATRHRHAQAIRERMQVWTRRGLFEPSDRFRWIEALGHARNAAQLRSVGYEFATAASPVALHDTAQPPPGPRLSETRLTVHAQLAHEEQLLRFLRALDAEPGGALRVRTCEMRRLADMSDPSVILDAQCELSVFNAQPMDKT